MKAWPEIKMKPVPIGVGKVAIKDSSSKKNFNPFLNKKLDIYVCGITPYDAAHVGHLFTYLIFDTLIRTALDLGFPVTYVQNITDIDDPLFERARDTGETWQTIAETQIKKYQQAMTYLRLLPPNHFYSVTESMIEIKAAAQKLESSSYATEDAQYFKSNAEKLGAFTNMSQEELIELVRQRGGDPDTLGKFSPLDPKIWLRSAQDEPAWESVFGQGRPGWHIECVAIANNYFSDTFDVQGGGKDLIFPHHAMCEQMNQVLFNRPLARGFMHVDLVGYQGEKMSKSLGNLVFIEDLLARKYSANVIRLGLLAQDWREYWEFNYQIMNLAGSRLNKWTQAVKGNYFPSVEVLRHIFNEHLYSDLNISSTLAAVDAQIDQKNIELEQESSINLISNLFGIDLSLKV